MHASNVLGSPIVIKVENESNSKDENEKVIINMYT